jgi:hypothetical protein
MNLAAIIIVALVFAAMAFFFRRALKSMENPQFVLEKPPLPKDLAAAVIRIDKWKAEGRITQEDYERLMYLCEEDAAAHTASKKP